jgi:Fic family protein
MELKYHSTPDILRLTNSLLEKFRELDRRTAEKEVSDPGRKYRIDTIHFTMQLECKILSREKTEAVIKDRYVQGPKTRIQEVRNALEVYDHLKEMNPWSQDSLLASHKTMTAGLAEYPGRYRTTEAAVFRGRDIIGMALPPGEVPRLMDDLFEFLNSPEEPLLIKSCIAHYSLEHIQPFMDFNGMMGRLWNKLLLMQETPVFEILPYEKLIYQTRKDHYSALTESEKAGHPTEFIHYMLKVINHSLQDYRDFGQQPLSASDRLLYFHKLGIPAFTRKNYMKVFKNISPATASRDLEKGVNAGLFGRRGTKNATVYSWLEQ